VKKEGNIQENDKYTAKEMAVITESTRQANEYSDRKLSDRFRDISWIVVGVVIVLFIAFIQMVISLFQINNAAYKDYSQRIEERDQILNDYREAIENQTKLLEKINTQLGEK